MINSKKVIDNRKKNTVRKVSEETKRIVYERDKGCVVCGSDQYLEPVPHHAYYGIEAVYTDNRNDPDQLVTICCFCHRDIHSKGDTEKREFCKTYLKKYGNNTGI